MENKLFEDEEITEDDLYFMCYMIERVSRATHQRNCYTVNKIGYDSLVRLISSASILHCENPLKIEAEWIEEFGLEKGEFDVTNVDPHLVTEIPTATAIGKMYKRLIVQTLTEGEDYIQGLIRVYNSPITEVLDDYEAAGYYAPSYIIKRAYEAGTFNAVG
ncbi:hypothetical protein [Anaerosporobacter sp.]|uniref:hypothetical protein n=1 Tax=Anaerosporobacter sp. TaxID=1872529 RepID=UPI00286F8479|nr:hypothetical protein [Anaerosporobacter sp.]